MQSLTGPEVRKDIREIQRTTQCESDSECSVNSEDILHSVYPVKPRKNPKNLSQIQRDVLRRNEGGSTGPATTTSRTQASSNAGGIQHSRHSREVEKDQRLEPQAYDTALADPVLQYIDGIKASKRSIYDAEMERQRIEEHKEVRSAPTYPHPPSHPGTPRAFLHSLPPCSKPSTLTLTCCPSPCPHPCDRPT